METMYKHHTEAELQSMANRASELHNRILCAGPGDADRRYYVVYSASDSAGRTVGYYLRERVLNQARLVTPEPAARRIGSYEDPVSIAELHAYLSGLISALELANT